MITGGRIDYQVLAVKGLIQTFWLVSILGLFFIIQINSGFFPCNFGRESQQIQINKFGPNAINYLLTSLVQAVLGNIGHRWDFFFWTSPSSVHTAMSTGQYSSLWSLHSVSKKLLRFEIIWCQILRYRWSTPYWSLTMRTRKFTAIWGQKMFWMIWHLWNKTIPGNDKTHWNSYFESCPY